MTMFTGFTPDAQTFLWEIRLNNERSWFEANKERYLTQVLQPLRLLGEELYDYMAEQYPQLGLNLHVSRIYRDARRLHGRGPYKDHLWFTLRHENENWTSRPVFYFELMPEGISYGMGFYCAAPSLMERFRREAAEDPAPLSRLARKLNRQDRFHLEGEEYARKKPAPAPVLVPWISRKHITVCRDEDYSSRSESRALVADLKTGFDFLIPYYQFFEKLCREEFHNLQIGDNSAAPFGYNAR